MMGFRWSPLKVKMLPFILNIITSHKYLIKLLILEMGIRDECTRLALSRLVRFQPSHCLTESDFHTLIFNLIFAIDYMV